MLRSRGEMGVGFGMTPPVPPIDPHTIYTFSSMNNGDDGDVLEHLRNVFFKVDQDGGHTFSPLTLPLEVRSGVTASISIRLMPSAHLLICSSAMS